MPRMAAADNEKQHGATGRPRQAKKDRMRREVIEASSSPSGRPQPQILKALRMTRLTLLQALAKLLPEGLAAWQSASSARAGMNGESLTRSRQFGLQKLHSPRVLIVSQAT